MTLSGVASGGESIRNAGRARLSIGATGLTIAASGLTSTGLTVATTLLPARESARPTGLLAVASGISLRGLLGAAAFLEDASVSGNRTPRIGLRFRRRGLLRGLGGLLAGLLLLPFTVVDALLGLGRGHLRDGVLAVGNRVAARHPRR